MRNGYDTLQKIFASCLTQKCRPEFHLGLEAEPGSVPDADCGALKEGIEERLQKAVEFVLVASNSSQAKARFISSLLRRREEDFFGLTGADLAKLYEWGVSLSWLLFGLGSVNKRNWDIPQSVIKSGAVNAGDLETIRLRFGWDTPEALWCFSWGVRQKNRSKSVLIRLLSSLPVMPVLPEMPDVLELFQRLTASIASINELQLNEIKAAEPWLKDAIQRLQESPHLVRLLLLANQAQFSSWKQGSRRPTVYTLRLAYFLVRSLDAFGAAALVTYLRVLHAEALHQGFHGFDEVVREGTWVKKKKKKKA